MKSLTFLFFAITGLIIFSSCRGDGNLNEEVMEGENTAIETQGFDPTTPPYESDRDPNVVYVDTEYLLFDNNNTINYSNHLIGREIRQHQFDLGGGEIITFHITSLYDRTMVTIINPQGERLVRTGFGGEDDPFRWNERFNEPGLYTIQLSLAHDVAAQGHWTDYDINLVKSF
jgi:hypothetical protein